MTPKRCVDPRHGTGDLACRCEITANLADRCADMVQHFGGLAEVLLITPFPAGLDPSRYLVPDFRQTSVQAVRDRREDFGEVGQWRLGDRQGVVARLDGDGAPSVRVLPANSLLRRVSAWRREM
jgi:hypothetical protein